VGRVEILDMDSDISDLKRQLEYEEDSKIWKGVKHQWQIRKELRDRFGPKEKTPRQIKTLASLDTFETQTDRLKAYNEARVKRQLLYFFALLGTVVLLV
tara:strand:- start:43 stop:339 length:297 start_codon:yes stop_codon:yes gene_type:complete